MLSSILDIADEIDLLEDELFFRIEQWEDMRSIIFEKTELKTQSRNLNGQFGAGSGQQQQQQVQITSADQAADIAKLSAKEKKAYEEFGKNRSKINQGLYKNAGKLESGDKKFINEQTKLLDSVTSKVRRLNTPTDTLRVFKTPDSDNFNDMGVNSTFNDSSFLTGGAPDKTGIDKVVNDKMPMNAGEFHATIPPGIAMVQREDNTVFGRRGLTFKVLENKADEEHRILRGEILRSSLTTYVPPKKKMITKADKEEGYDVWPEYVVALEDLQKVEENPEETDSKMLQLNKCIDKLTQFESRIKFLRNEIIEKRSHLYSLVGGSI